MKLTYQLVDGTITYDVTEVVMASTISFNSEGKLTVAQVVRRRYFSINGTPVKEDSQPANLLDLDSLRSEVLLPTALTVEQAITAMLLRFLQNLPQTAGMQGLVLPELPDDVGAAVTKATTGLSIQNSQLSHSLGQLKEAEDNLAAIQSKLTSAQSNLEYLERGAVSMAAAGDAAKLALDAEIQALEAKKNSYTDTLATLEQAIREKSDESTALQLKAAQLTAAATATES